MSNDEKRKMRTKSWTPQGGPLSGVGPGGRSDEFPEKNPPDTTVITCEHNFEFVSKIVNGEEWQTKVCAKCGKSLEDLIKEQVKRKRG